ncbi:invasion associated locus B family protein [Roseibium salinum]|uniref:Invasion associated locus B family protein n=1 Tax=Roseibium salinum TaxID=1604349 RepID=A0ABT3R0I1_9HYPH|nr:invasion associated locus B family protein [Roseibium sp. DSM 29163]MCX2722718.1 invasion associated locus B family protein [Roseibium sp. DSM 29163]
MIPPLGLRCKSATLLPKLGALPSFHGLIVLTGLAVGSGMPQNNAKVRTRTIEDVSMKSVLKRRLFGCATGALLAMSSFAGAPAIAQDQQEKSPWTKACNTNPNTQKEICFISIELRTNTGQFLSNIAIQETEGEARKKLLVAVPTGVLIQPGLRIQIDESKPVQAKYSICAPNACYAELAIDDSFINAMKQGSEIRVAPYNQQAKEIVFKMTLVGFTKVYDGEPMNLADLQKRQEELQSELQKRADEARQKLIDAQKDAQ